MDPAVLCSMAKPGDIGKTQDNGKTCLDRGIHDFFGSRRTSGFLSACHSSSC